MTTQSDDARIDDTQTGDVQTDYERVGAARLQAVIEDFVAATTTDHMIGYLFRDADPARLVRHEVQFTARALGARIPYEGEPIRRAHAKLQINGGEFARRSWLLKQSLEKHDVPADVVERLIAHMNQLRPLVVTPRNADCMAGASAGPLLVRWDPSEAEPA